MSRSSRRHFHMVIAILSLAFWLLMVTAEACPVLHAWLHGGAIPDGDDCAVVAIAHGKVESVDCTISVQAPRVWVEATPIFEISAFSPAITSLPKSRAPPILL
jgi:hypothetical protein